jgi:hypothetical protein
MQAPPCSGAPCLGPLRLPGLNPDPAAPNLATSQMLGAVVKELWAANMGLKVRGAHPARAALRRLAAPAACKALYSQLTHAFGPPTPKARGRRGGVSHALHRQKGRGRAPRDGDALGGPPC